MRTGKNIKITTAPICKLCRTRPLRKHVKRKHTATRGFKPALIQGEATSLPFRDEHFDCVVAIRLLKYIENSTGFLKELTRVTRLEGYLILVIPNLLSYEIIARSFFRREIAMGLWRQMSEYYRLVQLFNVPNLLRSISSQLRFVESEALFVIPEFFFHRSRGGLDLEVLRSCEAKLRSGVLGHFGHRQLVRLQRIA